MKKLVAILTALVILLSLNVSAAEKRLSFNSKWKVTASSDMGNTIMNAFDGNDESIWHSNYTADGGKITGHDEPPHIIEVDFGAETTVSGWTYLVRRTNFTGAVFTYNIYSSADGVKYEKIYTGEFDYGENFSDIGEKRASWGDKKMKKIKIEILTSQGGYGSAAEIGFLSGTNADGKNKMGSENISRSGKKLVDRTGWSVKVSSDRGDTAKNIIDGDKSSYWHSYFAAEGAAITERDNPPYDIELSFGGEETLSGIIIYQRADSSNGRILSSDIYAKGETGEYYPVMKDVSFASTPGEQALSFGVNIKTSGLKITVTSGISGYGTLGELYVIAGAEGNKTVPLSDAFNAAEENKSVKIATEALSISFSGESWGDNTPDKATDGDDQTFWQTAAQDKFPVSFTVDLGIVHDAVTAAHYLPRITKDNHGLWRKVSVYASTDGKTEVLAAKDRELLKTLDEKVIEFDKSVSARYFRFEISEAEEGRISVSELSLYETAASAKESGEKQFAEKEKFCLVIGENFITVKKGDEEKKTKIDSPPFIENGSTMIPLRGLFELMGADITWNGDDQSITVTDRDLKIELQVENKLVYVTDPEHGEVKLTLSSAPKIVSDRAFIPLRFVSEKLGYNVLWDGETRQITIYR